MPFIVTDHRLVHSTTGRVEYERARCGGGTITPRWVVMHYTAGNWIGTRSTLLGHDDVEVSAHLLVGRTGRVLQMMPFNERAWHAGRSLWQGDVNLNGCSIGIEIENLAFLRGDPSWPRVQGRRWQPYTDVQIESVVAITRALFAGYSSIKGVTGHEMIAPSRKSDPGPLFPWGAFAEFPGADACQEFQRQRYGNVT